MENKVNLNIKKPPAIAAGGHLNFITIKRKNVPLISCKIEKKELLNDTDAEKQCFHVLIKSLLIKPLSAQTTIGGCTTPKA